MASGLKKPPFNILAPFAPNPDAVVLGNAAVGAVGAGGFGTTLGGEASCRTWAKSGSSAGESEHGNKATATTKITLCFVSVPIVSEKFKIAPHLYVVVSAEVLPNFRPLFEANLLRQVTRSVENRW
jgi:hypothetical protein